MHASRVPRCISCMHGESRIEYSVSTYLYDFSVRGTTRINSTPVLFTGTGTAEFDGFRVHVHQQQFAAQVSGWHECMLARSARGGANLFKIQLWFALIKTNKYSLATHSARARGPRAAVMLYGIRPYSCIRTRGLRARPMRGLH